MTTKTSTRRLTRLAASLVCLVLCCFVLALPARIALSAQDANSTYSMEEMVGTGHTFFGNTTKGVAQAIEYVFQQAGRPSGYIIGEEASAAFVGGLRYGEGTLYLKNGTQQKVYWQGPSLGFDIGGNGSRTLVLIYNIDFGAGDLRPFRRHRGHGLFDRRHGSQLSVEPEAEARANSHRRRRAARRQCWLSEIHRPADLKSLLSFGRPGLPSLRLATRGRWRYYPLAPSRKGGSDWASGS